MNVQSQCWTQSSTRTGGARSIANALVASLCVHGALLGVFWQTIVRHIPDPPPLRVELAMPASTAPPATASAVATSAPPGATPERRAALPAPRRVATASAPAPSSASVAARVDSAAPSGDAPPTEAVAEAAASVREAPPGEQPIDLRVLDWLARYRSYPLAARRARIEGVVQLRVTLLPDGRLIDARIEQSSGHAVLDRAALDLLTRAAPLPGDHGSVRDRQIELELPIVYRMRT